MRRTAAREHGHPRVRLPNIARGRGGRWRREGLLRPFAPLALAPAIDAAIDAATDAAIDAGCRLLCQLLLELELQRSAPG